MALNVYLPACIFNDAWHVRFFPGYYGLVDSARQRLVPTLYHMGTFGADGLLAGQKTGSG